MRLPERSRRGRGGGGQRGKIRGRDFKEIREGSRNANVCGSGVE